jgi:hypothetical protein
MALKNLENSFVLLERISINNILFVGLTIKER